MIGLWITLGYFAVTFVATRLGYASYIDYRMMKKGGCTSFCDGSYHSTYCKKDKSFNPDVTLLWAIALCIFGIALFWPLTFPLWLTIQTPTKVARIKAREEKVRVAEELQRQEAQRLSKLRKELNF